MPHRFACLTVALLVGCGSSSSGADASVNDVLATDVPVRDVPATDVPVIDVTVNDVPSTDAAPDVTTVDPPATNLDAARDVSPDVASDDLPSSGACMSGATRCDGARVESCVMLADGTSAWAVTTTCAGIQTCAGTPPACTLAVVEPMGAVATVAGYTDGLPQGVVWNGTTGTGLFHYSNGVGRYLALFQFNASALVGPVYTDNLLMQGGRMVSVGAQTAVFWHDGMSTSSMALVQPGPTLGTPTAVMLGGMPVLTGFTLAGAAQGAMLAGEGAFGWFNAGTRSFSALGVTMADTSYTSGVATATTTGLALAWVTTTSALAFQTTSAAGALTGTVVSSTAPWASSDEVNLDAIVPRPYGYLLIWDDVTTTSLHFAQLSATGSLTSDVVVDPAYDYGNVVTPYVGINGNEVLLARGLLNYVNTAIYYALAVRGVDDTGTVMLPEFLVSSRAAVATFAAGMLAVCWTVDDSEGGMGGATGPRCGVQALP